MSKATPKGHRPNEVAGHRHGRFPAWLPLVLLGLLLAALGVAIWAMNRTSDPTATAGPPGPAPAPSPATAPPAISEQARQRLIGRWLRPDGGYVLTIARVAADGKAEAEYHNPRPIHVASAGVQETAGKLGLRVELRDRGYPGNYYTLTYDPASDRLVGIYHHLGAGQQFEVVFSRLK